MKLAVPSETRAGERRVALVPDVAKRLVSGGWEVAVQRGAGQAASFTDQAFSEAGASVVPEASAVYGGAAMVVKVQPPTAEEAAMIEGGAAVISFLQPASSLDALRVLAEKGASAFSFDFLPRISRAQGMDALSSQATVSGYRAGLVAATHLPRFFPMFMTAAGTVPPAKVLVMGAGVAGLQAIATARRLGAVVRAYDVRTAAREEAESLGASFVDLGVTAEGTGGYARELSPEELDRQRAALAAEVAGADVVIATAAVPGRTAPVLVTAEMVDGMGEGSVVIDLAADSGGNCELTEAGREVVRTGTTVVGMANPPSGMPTHASFLYARNVANLLALLGPDGSVAPDWDDEIVAGTCVLRQGTVVHAPTAELLGAAVAEPGLDHEGGGSVTNGILEYLTVFVLAAFVGVEVVSKVPSILHTPLMSGSNAIHGVILVGAMLVLGNAHTGAEEVLGFLAVILATLNVVGGFVVTDRMLEMFKGKPRQERTKDSGRPGDAPS